MAAPDVQGDPRRKGEASAPAPADSYDVFLSHNGKDKPAVRVLAERLKSAGLEPYLDAWHLVPGEPWQEALEEALQASRTCAVFLGPAGMGSWENEEMRAALSQRVRNPDYRVIPVLLPGAEFPSTGRLPAFLSRTTWVDFRPGLDDADAFDRLVSGIRGVAPEAEVVDPSAAINPFRGLEVFDEDHAEFFFGRDALTQQLVEQLREDRFLAVIGPSGSGKSSVVRAGLVPQLRHGALPRSDTWHVSVLRPGSHPLESLAARLVPVLELPGSPIAEQGAILDLLGKDERGLHNAVAIVVAEESADARVVIVIDQFEELFAPETDVQQRDRFVANLLYASSIAGGQTVVVLTMRADFFGKCASIPALAARIADRDVLVPPLSADGIRDAIVKPAQRVGLEFEKGLVDTIVHDLGTAPGALPLLQLTLLELWEGRRGRWLTTDRYHEIGGVQGAIAQRAEAAFARLTVDQQKAARRVLLRLTSPGEGTEDSRRRATLSELMPDGPEARDVQAVIDELTNARLLTTTEEPGGEVVDVAHEALIRGWPRLQQWVDEDPVSLRVHRRLTETANAWAAAGRDPSDLYRGARLDEAVRWASRDPEDLNEVERAFLDASVRLRDEDVRARERRRRLIGTGIGLAGIAIAATAIVALFNWQRAESERAVAETERELADHAAATSEARLVLSEGQRVAQSEPSLGLRLVAEGLHRATDAGIPTEPFREELIRQLQTGRYARLGTEVESFDLVGEGPAVLVDDRSGNGRLVRVTDGTSIDDLPAPIMSETPASSFSEEIKDASPNLTAVRFENQPGLALVRVTDGSTVELAGPADRIEFAGDRVVVQYRAGESDNPELEDVGPWIAEIRSGADGSLIASIDEPFSALSIVRSPDWASAFIERENALELIGLAGGERLGSWSMSGGSGTTDDGTFGASTADETIGGTITTTNSTGDSITVSTIRFPLDRPLIALTTSDGRCLVIHARDGEQRLDLPGRCTFLALSQDGSTAAASADWGPVHVVSVEDGRTLSVLTDESYGYFSPEPGAARIAMVDAKRRVRLFEPSTGRLVSDLNGVTMMPPDEFPDQAVPIEFSSNGKSLLVNTPTVPAVFNAVVGRRIPLPRQYPGDETNDPYRVRFSHDEDAAYMIVSYDGHTELLRDGSIVLLDRPARDIEPWPEAGPGPILVVYPDGSADLLDWNTAASIGPITGNSLQASWASPSTPAAAAIQRDEIDQVSEAPLILVGADGTWSPSPGQSVTKFSPERESTSVVIRRADEASELWNRTGERRLAFLGLGVSNVEYTPDGTKLAVGYRTGELDLLSVVDLRALPLPSALASLTDGQLLDLVCTGSVGQTVDDADIQAAIGAPPGACN